MIRRFLGALQFLTLLPIPVRTSTPGEAAVFFPLAGALLGASAGGLMVLLGYGLDRSLSALLAIAFLAVITGCLHEDALADVADAVRAGRTPEKIMDILKDSRIGSYGAVAVVLSLAARWQALAQGPVNPIPGLAAALALSRASLVGLAAITPSAGRGLGRAFAAACTPAVVFAVAPQAIALTTLAALSIGWLRAAALLVSTAVIVLLARVYFIRRLGGVNGDCLGATCQAVEIVNLVILAWHPSI